ncbi:MAG: proteasome assembly chaperone family protein [Halodesulfurarchaeum sp.]
MEEIDVESIADVDLDDPVLIEGLPGVGLVGKLAVDHLVSELESEPVRRIYAEHLPPAVSVDEEGTATLTSLTLHAVDAGEQDLLVLTGEGQAQSEIGQYRLADAVVDLAAEFEASAIVTLGGYGTGEQIDEYAVVGAVPDADTPLKMRLADAGVSFGAADAPGSIVGMSGLLVGLGDRRGFETAGLLGVTPGFHVDPASARAVLEVLQDAFGFDVSLDTLSDQAAEVQQLLEQIQQAQQGEPSPAGAGENLRYIG